MLEKRMSTRAIRIVAVIMVIIAMSVMPVKAVLVPKRVNIIHAFIENENGHIPSSQPLGDELFYDVEAIEIITHDGNAELVYFTRENGFVTENDFVKMMAEDACTLVQVFLGHDSMMECSDILHIREKNGKEYEVHIAVQDGVLQIEKVIR